MNTRIVSLARLLLIAGLCIGLASCTLVREDDDDNEVVNGGNDDEFIFNDIPADATVVDAVIFVELTRGSSKLMSNYHTYFNLLEAALTERGVFIRKLAVAPLYRRQSGRPLLLYGRGSPDNLSPSLEETLEYFVSDDGLAHLDSEVETPGENPAALGLDLGGETIFNPDVPSAEARPYFDPPEDGLLVFHFANTERACGHDQQACALDGQNPTAYFTATGEGDGASWLSLGSPGLAPSDIVHVPITTAEGVDYETFADDCESEINFPTALLDFLAPSSHEYFGPFVENLNDSGGAAVEVDLCVAFSDRALTSSMSTALKIGNKLH